MDLLHNLYIGFGVAFTPENLFYALLGCLLGRQAAAAARRLLVAGSQHLVVVVRALLGAQVVAGPRVGPSRHLHTRAAWQVRQPARGS